MPVLALRAASGARRAPLPPILLLVLAAVPLRAAKSQIAVSVVVPIVMNEPHWVPPLALLATPTLDGGTLVLQGIVNVAATDLPDYFALPRLQWWYQVGAIGTVTVQYYSQPVEVDQYGKPDTQAKPARTTTYNDCQPVEFTLTAPAQGGAATSQNLQLTTHYRSATVVPPL